MSCCAILKAGCFNNCDSLLITDITGLADEEVIIEYQHNGVWLSTEAEALEGEPLEIINVFNEYGDVVFRIKRQDGSYYPDNYQISIK